MQKSRRAGDHDDHGRPSFFTRFSAAVSAFSGHPATFIAALALVIGWAATGPMAGFSETWQLVINTGTTIVTFLMVFVIQATQNRDTAAMHLKLDELIRVTDNAHNALLNIDNMDEKRLESLRALYCRLGKAAAENSDIVAEMERGMRRKDA